MNIPARTGWREAGARRTVKKARTAGRGRAVPDRRGICKAAR